MPFASVNGIELYYEVRGSGPALLFAHGQGGNHLVWWQQVPFFAEHYTCITFDARAFGQSHDVDGRGRMGFRDDAVALLEHLGIDEVSVVGHSMGGRTAIAIALRSEIKVRAVVFSGTVAGAVDDEIRAKQRQAAEARGGRGLGAFSLAPSFRGRDPATHFLYSALSRLNPPRPRDFLAPAPNAPRGSTAPRLIDSGIPILFLVGAEDAITPPDMIEMCHRIVPGSRYARIEGAGHSTYFEKPAEFNEVVLRFLREVEGSGGDIK